MMPAEEARDEGPKRGSGRRMRAGTKGPARREAGAAAPRGGGADRLEEAILLASRFHRGQTRKGTDIPYLFHLLAVAAIVAEHGGDEEQIIAALLHDAIEDAGGDVAREQIRRRFGEGVAAIVETCTDADTVPKPPWRARKERFLARLATAPPRAQLVVAADKLHNAESTLRELRREGGTVWRRFRGGREGTLWYYDAVLRTLSARWDHPILADLAAVVGGLHGREGRQGRGKSPPGSDRRSSSR